MKLSNREKTLFILLAIVIFGGIYVNYILWPQWLNKVEIEKQYDQLVQVINDINEYTDPQSSARQEHLKMEENILAKSLVYFPEINQETIIIIFSEMMNEVGINPTSAKFSKISESIVESLVVAPMIPGDYPLRDLSRSYKGVILPGPAQISSETPITIEKMELGLQVQGTYAQIIALMNEIETYSRKIHISKIDFSLNQDGTLKCLMMVHVYGVPKVLNQDLDLAWSIFDLYGRDNPFRY